MDIKKFLLPILLSISLFWGGYYLYYHPKVVQKVLVSLEKNENVPDFLKSFVINLFRDVENLSFDIKRENISKKELPVIEIFMSNGALKKIEKKRLETLDKKRPILITDDSDWVKATIIVDNGKKREKVKASLRLKGDWGDHLADPKKLSFRIKVKGDGYIFGMKKLSIQHPKTRNYQYEALILDMMRKNGILSPRYFLVDVRVNGYKIGLMALEEHFSKELVESQDRRDAPILAIDEDVIWKQRDINYNVCDSNMTKYKINPDWTINIFNDYPIKEFKNPPFIKGTIPTNNSIRAISLLRDYLDERISADKVFDYRSYAKWWIIENIWGAYHGIYYQNKRFYFNPIISKFEPVAFDNIPKPFYIDPKLDNSKYFFNFAHDKRFWQEVIKALREIENQLYNNEFVKEFNVLQDKWLFLMGIEDMHYKKVPIERIRYNLNLFVKYLYDNYESFRKREFRIYHKDDNIGAVGRYEKLGIPLASHIRAFAFLQNGDILLEIKNQTTNPIKIDKIYYTDKKGHRFYLKKDPFTILPYKKGENRHIVSLTFPKNPNFPNRYQIKIEYEYKSSPFIKEAILQFREHDFGFKDFFEYAKDKENIEVDKENKRVVFKKGDYEIEESLFLDGDWEVVFEKGVSIVLKNGALFKIKGSLKSLGNKEEPILIKIETNTHFKDMGSWGGIFVLRGERKSFIKDTHFMGQKGVNLKNRQDYYGITGCVSFYESEVKIENSKFIDMQCEDALNIVRSSFDIENLFIKGSRADAFDSDFSKGEIRDSKFEDIGNDGIDVSGTFVKVKNVYFKNISDKAISVGEKSTLYGKDLFVENATSGVVSKDLSKAFVENVVLKNIRGSALLAFIKKEEYGSAFIECKKCKFENVKYKASPQIGSTIIVNKKSVKGMKFTRRQLEEAGLVVTQ